MIKLSDSSFLTLPNCNGALDIVNLDLLSERLQCAFNETGYPNPGFCRDILSTVIDYIEYLHCEGQAFSLAEVENTITKILCNTGYYNVASGFSSPAHRLIKECNEKLIFPTKPVIHKLLAQDHFFNDKPIDEISDTLLNKLFLLGFEKITEALLIALARNIYLSSNSGNEGVFGNTEIHSQVWHISPRAVRSLLNEKENRLFQNGVVTIKPLSLLIPIVKILIQLEKIREKFDQADLIELKFYPEFDELCATLRNIIKKLSIYMNMNNRFEEGDYSIEVLFNLKKDNASEKSDPFYLGIRAQLPELKKIAFCHFPSDYRIRFSID